MTRATLAQTLTALADGATPQHPGLSVTEAEIALPLVVSIEHGPDGPLIVAHPPYSTMATGFDPIAHRARMSFHEVPHEAEPNRNPAAGSDGVT